MTDILAQIGDKLGSKIKELEAQINSGGGGEVAIATPTPIHRIIIQNRHLRMEC